MNTVKMWASLAHPNDAAPLYRNLRLAHTRYEMWSQWGYGWTSGIMVVATVLLSPLLTFMLPLATITVIGGYWAGSIAGGLQNEADQHRADLLGILPGGQLAAQRTLMTIFLRRGRIFEFVAGAIRSTTILGYIVVLIIGSSGVIFVFDAEYRSWPIFSQHLNLVVSTALLFFSIHAEQMQAVVLSGLCAMVAPLHTHDAISARLWAVMLFASVQVGLYVFSFTVGIWVLLPLLTGPLVSSILIATITGLLIGLREVTIRYMWRLLTRTLGEPQ